MVATWHTSTAQARKAGPLVRQAATAEPHAAVTQTAQLTNTDSKAGTHIIKMIHNRKYVFMSL